MEVRSFEQRFYGLARHRASWAQLRLKGSIVRSRRRYIDAHAPRMVSEIREALSPEAARYLDGDVLVSERVPYAPLVELDEQIARRVMRGDVAQMRPFAWEIASHDLDGGLYRNLLSTLGAGLSLRLYATLYQTIWQPGDVTARADGDGIHITLTGTVLPRYMCTYGFTGYVERLLEIASSPSDVVHHCLHDGAAECTWTVTRR